MTIGTSGANLSFIATLLEAPAIILLGTTFEFKDCLTVNPNVVQLQSLSDTALIKAIDITFDKKAITPPLINGTCNLETGDIDILFFSAKKVAIQFCDSVLN